MKNKLIIFTGPSGVGKATIERRLFGDEQLNIKLACSATTRKPRVGEIEGEHYFFISHEKFDNKINNGEFVEWNEHFSNKYGTLRTEIEKISENGNHPFLEIETFGARNIIRDFGDDKVISIFIAPPSVDELKSRIQGRGTETPEQIEERMAKVEEEMSQKRHFQNIVINDDVERAAEEIKEIIMRNK